MWNLIKLSQNAIAQRNQFVPPTTWLLGLLKIYRPRAILMSATSLTALIDCHMKLSQIRKFLTTWSNFTILVFFITNDVLVFLYCVYVGTWQGMNKWDLLTFLLGFFVLFAFITFYILLAGGVTNYKRPLSVLL